MEMIISQMISQTPSSSAIRDLDAIKYTMGDVEKKIMVMREKDDNGWTYSSQVASGFTDIERTGKHSPSA
jgi:hypothetical protein